MVELELKERNTDSGPHFLKAKAILVAMAQLGGLQIILALSGLVRNKVAAVYLKTAGMGEWAQIQGVATTVFVIVQFGMVVGLSRNTAAAKTERDRQEQLSVANTLTMGMALLALLLAICFFLVPARHSLLGSLGIHADFELLLILFVVVLAPVEGLRNNFLSFLQGVLDIGGIATKRSITAIFATVAAIPLVSMFGVTGACLQFAVTSVLLAVLLGHRCYQLGYRPLRFQWERSSAVSLVTVGGALLVVNFAGNWADVFIRSLLIRHAGLSEAGMYQAAFLLSSQVTQIALGSIGVFSLASISRSTDPEFTSHQLHVMYQVILPISAIGLGLLGLLEGPAVQLLFSFQFKSSSDLLPLLLVGNSLQAAAWVTGAPLLGCGKVRAWITLLLIGAALRVLTAAAFLPLFGTQAIPLSFLLGQVFDMLTSLFLCSRSLKIRTSRADLARIGFSSALPGIVALLGLRLATATFAVGLALLIAGAIILAPAQFSGLARRATELLTRCYSPYKTRPL